MLLVKSSSQKRMSYPCKNLASHMTNSMNDGDGNQEILNAHMPLMIDASAQGAT